MALPGGGWLLVDGCAPKESEPTLLALHRRFARQGDRTYALVLTHPHDDHAQGFAQAVEALEPEHIVITARSPTGEHLLECARAWLAGTSHGATSEQLRYRTVVSALKAIERWEAAHPGGIVRGVDGQQVSLPGSPVTAFIRAPAAGAHLHTVLDELAQGRRARANQASLVLELVFGAARLILGGDLPVRDSNGVAVPTGWQRVMQLHEHLSQHVLLKLPHHGSEGALDETLMEAATNSSLRIWACTPHDRSGLPDRARALPWLLSRNAPLHLTHPSSRWVLQASAASPEVAMNQVLDKRGQATTGDPFADGAGDLQSPQAPSALAPVWAFAFDSAGSLRGRWFGETALALTP